MQLKLNDPEYTERLASFFQGLGQPALIAAPDRVELLLGDTPAAEIEIYLRVWQVLHPDSRVELLEPE